MNKYREREPGKLPSLEFSDGLTPHALGIRAKPFASQACHRLISEGQLGALPLLLYPVNPSHLEKTQNSLKLECSPDLRQQ